MSAECRGRCKCGRDVSAVIYHAQHADGVAHEDGLDTLPEGAQALGAVDGADGVDDAGVAPLGCLHAELDKVERRREEDLGGAGRGPDHSGLELGGRADVAVGHVEVDPIVQEPVVDDGLEGEGGGERRRGGERGKGGWERDERLGEEDAWRDEEEVRGGWEARSTLGAAPIMAAGKAR